MLATNNYSIYPFLRRSKGIVTAVNVLAELDLSEAFILGFAQAKADIEAVYSEAELVAELFSDFVSGIPTEEIDHLGLAFLPETYSLRLVCILQSDFEVSRLDYDLDANQLLYSDFRGIPKYPLPPNRKSFAVLAKYFGISVGYFVDKEKLDVHFSTSITLRRNTLKSID